MPILSVLKCRVQLCRLFVPIRYLAIYQLINGLILLLHLQLTVADLIVYDTMTMFPVLKGMNKDADAFFERIGSLPKIKEWIEKRPQTQY